MEEAAAAEEGSEDRERTSTGAFPVSSAHVSSSGNPT